MSCNKVNYESRNELEMNSLFFCAQNVFSSLDKLMIEPLLSLRLF